VSVFSHAVQVGSHQDRRPHLTFLWGDRQRVEITYGWEAAPSGLNSVQRVAGVRLGVGRGAYESFLEQAKPAAQVGICGPQPRFGEHLGEQ
jgi:hypothetical protein